MTKTENTNCSVCDDDASEHLSFVQIYMMLNDNEREKVIAYAETLKGKRHSP